jgi:error-prone DNA polymerase
MLNSQPLGFYAPAQLIGDARRHGVQVHPVDVAASHWDCTLEEGDEGAFGVRLGMRQIKGMSATHAERIVAARAMGPFTSIEDFARRTHLGRPVLERLSQADAFASLGTPRRQALWRAWGVGESSPLFDDVPCDEPPVELPPRPPQAEVAADYRTTGLSLRGHPVGFLRPQLEERQVVKAADLIQHKSGRWIRVAGIVLLRQRPGTASGITFVTLEDETGPANLIIRPEVWQRNRRVARGAHAVIAHGHLQIHDSIVHVLVEKLEDLSPLVADLNWQSRDFR